MSPAPPLSFFRSLLFRIAAGGFSLASSALAIRQRTDCTSFFSAMDDSDDKLERRRQGMSPEVASDAGEGGTILHRPVQLPLRRGVLASASMSASGKSRPTVLQHPDVDRVLDCGAWRLPFRRSGSSSDGFERPAASWNAQRSGATSVPA